jgi:hypothetical protein
LLYCSCSKPTSILATHIHCCQEALLHTCGGGQAC